MPSTHHHHHHHHHHHIYVNSAPSSGCMVGFPTIAATARGCRSGVALPPASPHSRVCPRRRGESPSGDLTAPPALSLRGRGMEVLVRPPSTGRMREEDFPSLVTPVADEGGFTSVSFATSSTLFMSADFRPKDVAWGFTRDPLAALPQAVGLGECGKHPQRGLGRSSRQNRIW